MAAPREMPETRDPWRRRARWAPRPCSPPMRAVGTADLSGRPSRPWHSSSACVLLAVHTPGLWTPEMSYPLFSVVGVGRGCDGFLRGVPGCAAAGADPGDVAHRAPAGVGRPGRAARWPAGSGGVVRRAAGRGDGPAGGDRQPGGRLSDRGGRGGRHPGGFPGVGGGDDRHAGGRRDRVHGAGRVGDRGHRPGPAGVPGVGPGVRGRPGVRPARVGDPGHHARSEAAGAGGGRGGGSGRGHRPAGNPACAASHRRCPGRRARAALAMPSSGPAGGCG